MAVDTKLLTAAITDEVDDTNQRHKGSARVLVRPSGTEELVRVLVEAKDEKLAEELCDKLVALASRELG